MKKTMLQYIMVILSITLLSGCTTSNGSTEKPDEKELVQDLKDDSATEIKDGQEGEGPDYIFKKQYEPSKFTQKDVDSDTVQWICSAYAIYTYYNKKDLGVVGGAGDENKDSYELAIKSALSGGWNITGRESSIKQIQKLLKEGHRTKYRDLVAGMKERGLLELTEEELVNRAADSGGNVREFKAVYNAYQAYGEKAIDGWDYCRILQVLGDCYQAGYISLEECLDQSLAIARELQGEFSSWEEVAQSYLYGYQYWKQDSSETEERWEIYQELAAMEDGPYIVPFDTELEESWKNVTIKEEPESEPDTEEVVDPHAPVVNDNVYTISSRDNQRKANVKRPEDFEEGGGSGPNRVMFDRTDRKKKGGHYLLCWIDTNDGQTEQEIMELMALDIKLAESHGAKGLEQGEIKTHKVNGREVSYTSFTYDKTGPHREAYTWTILDDEYLLLCTVSEGADKKNFEFLDLEELVDVIYSEIEN